MRTLRHGIVAVLLVVGMLTSGCAFLSRVRGDLKATYCSTGLQCATTILTDFRWGVDQAGSRGELDAGDVEKVDVVVDGALAAVASHPADWRAIVAAALSAIQANVHEPTSWVPFVSAALLVLPLIPRTADEMV